MSPVRTQGAAVATTSGGPVAYVQSTRVPVVGARDVPEEKV